MSFCMEYPCGECQKEVGEDDRAIQCKGKCQSWYHCACIGIGEDEYDHLSSSDDSWSCSLRKNYLPSFNSVDAVDVVHFDFQKNMPGFWVRCGVRSKTVLLGRSKALLGSTRLSPSNG